MDTGAQLRWRVANVSNREADIDIYDVIGDPFFGVDSAEFAKDLRALDVDVINFHINSPGGYVNDALAMFNEIQAHPATTRGFVVGAAESAASFVLQAMDERIVAKNAKITIHEGVALVIGTAMDMREAGAMLEEESLNIAEIYAERAGGKAEDWRERMQAGSMNSGTSYRGQEAVDIGLADRVGIASRNRVPGKVVAQVDDEDEGPTLPFDTRGLLEAAKRKSPEPTFEQLLRQQSPGGLSTAAKTK